MADSTAFGKYRLIAELGHGGMADVFLAVQAGPAGSGFSKLTVVKRLRKNLAEEAEFVSMLVDEARIAARLNHQNVVQTNEVGEVDGQYFIAMEYLDGQPFHRTQHRLAQRAKDGHEAIVTTDQQVLIMMDALAGLHHAHELKDYDGSDLGIVHRDVTPHNIFVTYEGVTKVVDFGIAKAAGRSSETRQGVVKGKVRYMAPEQAIGQSVDRRADIFAAGIILWEIVSGRRLWANKDDMEVVQALVSGDLPRSPRSVNAEVPEELDRICARALAHEPENRYTTAEEFATDLEQYLLETGKLVEARRKLGAAVGELFKDKRSEIRSVIESQLALLSREDSDSCRSMPVAPTMTGITAIMPDGDSSPGLPSRPFATTTDGQSSTLEPVGPRASARSRSLVVGALAIAAVAAGVALYRSRPPAQAAVLPTTASELISVRLSGSPANAMVRIDQNPPRPLPLETAVARDDRDHVIRIEAEGFIGKTEHVSFAHDLSLPVDLVPQTPIARAADSGSAHHPSLSAHVAPTPAPRTDNKAPTTPNSAAAQPEKVPEKTTTTADPPKTPRESPRLGIDDTDPWKK